MNDSFLLTNIRTARLEAERQGKKAIKLIKESMDASNKRTEILRSVEKMEKEYYRLGGKEELVQL